MNLFPQNGYKAALYLRLSRDEDSRQESNSIVNQRRILTEYAQGNGYTVEGEYADDGWSGTNFQRPGFQKMLEDIRAGKINMVIVKDLSRLGREYIGTGQYIEQIFPELGVRFIAIGDGYDSLFDDEPSADMMPMLNFFNEFHAKQSSKKSRTSKKSMAKAGMFVGTKAPYGYVIDPDDKHHLLVDPEAAEIVKMIFQYACDGLGCKAIMKRLRDAKILNPSAYGNIKFPTTRKSDDWRKPYDWHPSSIKTILSNPTYLGKVVSGRRRVKSFKCKDIITMPEEEWIVVDDMHEPLIDQRTWDTAQEKMKIRKRTTNNGSIQIFAGLLKCADCGYSMAYRSNPVPSYNCSLNNVKGKGYCKSHFITYDTLYEIVLEDIRRKATAATGNGKKLLERLAEENADILQRQSKLAEQEISRLESRIAELDTIIGKLYEDGALGRIPPERAQSLMANYESEQHEAKTRVDAIHSDLENQRRKDSDMACFMQTISKYANLRELDVAILNELIDRIEVSSKENVDGVKTQRVRICYRQVGYFSGNLWDIWDSWGQYDTYRDEGELHLARQPYDVDLREFDDVANL